MAHIVPGFSIMMNFAISDVVLRASHVKTLPMLAVLYGFQNYYETKKRGKPLYSFLTWEDSSTVFIYGGLIAGFSLIYVGLASLSVGLKRSQAKRADD